MKLHQITEDDLATLERSIPLLVPCLMNNMGNRERVLLRQIQEILSSVRWNYGPPSEIEKIEPKGEA